MSRSYVFLVHGVGRHPADTWADPWKSALIGHLQQYTPYDGMTAAQIEQDVIAFKPISYDRVFEAYRSRWGNLATSLLDQEIMDSGTATEVIEWIAGHDDDDEIKQIFWDKALDALLWMTLPQARAAVIATVVEQLVDGLIEMRDESPEDNAHIVAHSLGTSVIHDSALCLEAAEKVHDGSFDARRFKWNSLFMVANTSRLLTSWTDISDELDPADLEVYTSDIEPGKTDSVCRAYRNVRHTIDPITWLWPFHTACTWNPSVYDDVEIKRYKLPENVHDFTNYAADPEVHLRLFQWVLRDSMLGADEFQTAIDAHAAEYTEDLTTAFTALRDKWAGNAEDKLLAGDIIEFLIEAYKEVDR